MLSVFRIVAGLVFMSAGTMKLFNYPPSGMPGFPVNLMSEAGVAGILETFGGLAVVLGFARSKQGDVVTHGVAEGRRRVMDPHHSRGW